MKKNLLIAILFLSCGESSGVDKKYIFLDSGIDPVLQVLVYFKENPYNSFGLYLAKAYNNTSLELKEVEYFQTIISEGAYVWLQIMDISEIPSNVQQGIGKKLYDCLKSCLNTTDIMMCNCSQIEF